MSPRPLIPHRRELILEKAEELLLDVGFDAMTMQELASRVGIAKGSVYREFATKEKLLDEVLASAFARVQQSAAARVGQDRPPRLSAGHRAFAEGLVEEPLLCAAFLDDGGVLGSQVSRITDGRYRERHLGVEAWIEELQTTGALSTRVPAPDLALALSSATLGLLTAARTLGPFDADDLQGALRALEVMVGYLET